jgi:ribosomal protein L31
MERIALAKLIRKHDEVNLNYATFEWDRLGKEVQDYYLKFADAILAALSESASGMELTSEELLKAWPYELELKIYQFKNPVMNQTAKDKIQDRLTEAYKAVAKAQLAKCQLAFAVEKADLEKRIADLKDGSLTYCVYCGREFLIDDTAGTKVIKHINTCEKHPLFKANQRIKELEAREQAIRREEREKVFDDLKGFEWDAEHNCVALTFDIDYLKSIGQWPVQIKRAKFNQSLKGGQ